MLNSFVVNFDKFCKNAFKVWRTFDGRHKAEVTAALVRRSWHELAPNQMFSLSYQRPLLYHGWEHATLEAITINVIQSRTRSSNSRKRCRWSGTACLGTAKKFPQWPKACFKATCKGGHYEHCQWILTVCCYGLNDVNFCVKLICSNVFECARIARWQRRNADNFKTVYDINCCQYRYVHRTT